MEQLTSDEARSGFRDLLDEVLLGEHVTITRHGKPTAVIVPVEWYEEAEAAIGEARPS